MGIGFPELVVILVIVLLVFGAGKITSIMADLGKGMKAFKGGMQEAEMTEKKQISAPKKQVARSITGKSGKKKA